MMQVLKFVELMVKTKLWPVKVDSDGTFKPDLMHTAVLIPFFFALVALSVVLYFTFPGLLFRDWTKMSQIIDFSMVCTLVLAIPGIFGTTSSIQALGPLISETNATLTPRIYINFLARNLLYAAHIISIEIMVIPQPNFSSTTKHLLYWTSLVYMNLYLILMQMGVSGLQLVSMFSFIDGISATSLKIKQSTEDIKSLKDHALRLNSYYDSSMPVVFLFLQISFIFGFYMVIVQDTFPFHALLQFLFNSYAVLSLLNQIEECYSLAHDLACKARENSADCKTISEMTKVQAAVQEMEACFPFEPKGYFALEKSTLTALAANTLTYLIVLLQFNFE